jgi:hypothetical protein
MAPKVLYAFEFGCSNGQVVFTDAEEGRDLIISNIDSIEITRRPDPYTTEDIVVYRKDLAYLRKVTTVVEDEAPVDAQLKADLKL